MDNAPFCLSGVSSSQEQKRYIEQQLNTDHEGPFGSRVSPNRPASSKKAIGPKLNGSISNGTPPNRRLSISGQQNGGGHGVRSGGKDSKKDTAKIASPGNNNAAAAAPAPAAAKEETASHISGTDPVPSTP